ncbi:MAG: RNA 3'-phosphate cyclase [Anaerolineae bacterium]|nr:RNA 3'-phosphate cyclase [Anaerolineae bacterium]
MLKIDGSYGEGGGQIIRTALTLSCITQMPVKIRKIRAGRDKPGLRPQHVMCIEAAAALCGAEVTGAEVGSDKLSFRPTHAVKSGGYQFEIGTAGATSLVMQTVLLPLALAEGSSTVYVTGGTHVPYSPSGHYLRDVYAPMLVQSGADVLVQLVQYGWYPEGGGAVMAQIQGHSRLTAQTLLERGDLERIFGVGLASNLPITIPHRIAVRAEKQLADLRVPLDIRPEKAKGRSTGAGVFLTAEYSNGRGGFSCIGERGVSSEIVADRAAEDLLRFHKAKATVDPHLADQLLLILAVAQGKSNFITSEVTRHLETNRWVIQQFIERNIVINSKTGLVEIEG